MDRSKSNPGQRGPKAKITQHPPDLIFALGVKQSSPRDDPKRPVTLPKPSSSHSGDKLKREASSSSLSTNPAKKLKVSIPGARTTNLLSTERNTTSTSESWETLIIDCEPAELFHNAVTAYNDGNVEKAIGLVLGALKSLRTQKFKPCKVVYGSLLLLCSCKPLIFTNDTVVTAMVNIIRRDLSTGYKSTNRSSINLPLILITIFSRSFNHINQWPEPFVKLFVEDAVGERIWIDNPFCKPFVDNLITAFGTKIPSKNLLTIETFGTTARDTSSPLTVNLGDDEEGFNDIKPVLDSWKVKTFPRYTQKLENVEKIVLEAIKEQLARRQQPDTITKNFVKFLSVACGLVEIRVIAVSRIETLLHNHKLMKTAQELLAYLCDNCSASSQRDLEVIAQLSKLRLKSKPMVQFFNSCLKEMVCSSPQNLYPLLKYTIYNELSNVRNSNNLVVVGALFQVAPEACADSFADICLELLLNKDDYLRSLRALFKEVNRVLRNDFNLPTVVKSLLKDRRDFANTVRDSEFRDRIFFSIVDLVSMCALLCISPQVREAANQKQRDPNTLKVFQAQVGVIQKEAIAWLHEKSTQTFRPVSTEYHRALLKILFLEPPENYCKIDSWPGENERNLFLRLVSEIPLNQATLLRILLIGTSKERMIHPNETLDIVEQIVKRAANLPSDINPPLFVDKIELFDVMFELCMYNYPENITLPIGYKPPNLAISVLYWRVWMVLLILAAHNPSAFGNVAWGKYSTLRMFMEMCITNHFSFPPPTMTSEDDFQNRELQIIVLEKQKILEFESHLAAASTKVEINEQNSLLLPQLMELKPETEIRRPVQSVLDQLETLNATHRLGHLLCRSRNPDFLLDIMSRQGSTAHMPWLTELVHNSEGALAHLPVQCLCEYLLSTVPSEKLTKQAQLLAHLRTVVNSNEPQAACEVLEYLFRRLTSDHGASRTQASKGLTLVLSPTEDPDVHPNKVAWLTHYIHQFPHFALIKPVLVQFLRQALLCETNPARVSSYINFLATQDRFEQTFPEISDLVADLSSVIIERHSVASYVLSGENNQTIRNLIGLFCTHIKISKELGDETLQSIQNYGDYVWIVWQNEERCAMLLLVIHAAIVLLTYGPMDDFELFNELLNSWFPANKQWPKAYLPDTQELTSYLPDWIKLRMIRSHVDRLVDAAIEKLEPQKLILFIQSFGIPTNSMSKLLRTLDKMTRMNMKLVVDSVLDKAYMIQLVEVQNKRGAVGGDTFVKAIEMPVKEASEAQLNLDLSRKKIMPGILKKEKVYSGEDVTNLLHRLFNLHGDEDKKTLISVLIKQVLYSNQIVLDKIVDYFRLISPQILCQIALSCPSLSILFELIFTHKNYKEEINHYKNCLLPLINDQNNFTAVVIRNALPKQTKELNNTDNLPFESQDNINKLEEVLKTFTNDNYKLDTTDMIKWFSLMEQETSNFQNINLQKEMLFSKLKLPFRPLLMSWVLQKANWQSLYRIMQFIFEENVENICPISSLNYLTALSESQKLWQGRDKAIPKHNEGEDVLCLNKSELLVVVNLILEEARMNKENWEKKMEQRVQLLLKNNGNQASEIIKHLMEKDDCFSKELILIIYMSIPASGQNNSKLNEVALTAYLKTYPSAVDKVAHTLLSALTATPRTKDWTRKSNDLEMLARKLTSAHPYLVVRILPLLAGCLKGRAQYDWNVLKSRGHLVLFRQVFGLVELMVPMVFQQPEVLNELLDSYFILLQYHGQSKDLSTLTYRLVVFIQNWMLKDVKSALQFVQEKEPIILDLQIVQPAVRSLLSNVSISSNDQVSTKDLLVGSLPIQVTDQLPPNWDDIVTSLQDLDNLDAFQNLEYVSNKKPALLKHVSNYLYIAINCRNGAVRNLALSLLVKWLKFEPTASKEALPAILMCLDSVNGDIVNDILAKLSEIVALMQDHAKIILTRVFKLGIKSSANTSGPIEDCITLLSLQSGC